MNINLIPKEKQEIRPGKNISQISIYIGMICLLLIGLVYFGYLWQQLKRNEAIIRNLDDDLKAQSGVYHQIQNIEASLRQLSNKSEIQRKIYSSYLPPLNVLETIIQLKPDLIWFDKIEFNSIDGCFTLTGGAVDYKVLAGFIGKLEQDKSSFTQVKPDNAVMARNETGNEYVQFKITGILTKRSVTDGQNP